MEPGIKATVPLQETTAQLLQFRYEHAKSRYIFDNHYNMDATLKTIALKAVNNNSVFTQQSIFMGYMGSSTIYIVKSMMD